jgi:hypothetical protein
MKRRDFLSTCGKALAGSSASVAGLGGVIGAAIADDDDARRSRRGDDHDRDDGRRDRDGRGRDDHDRDDRHNVPPLLTGSLDRSKLTPYIGHDFWVYEPSSGIVTISLAQIIDVPNPAGATSPPGFSQFTLLFRGQPGDTLADGTYAMESSMSGQFQLYVQSAGADANGNGQFRSEFCLI